MFETTDILMLILAPVLLCCSAFFSGSETALFSLNRHEQRRLSRSHSNAASMITRLLNDKQALLITLLTANMFVNVLYYVISTVFMNRLHRREDGMAAVSRTVLEVSTLLLLILFGEVLPKLIASRHASAWATLGAFPVFVLHQVVRPIRVVLQGLIVNPLSRLVAPQQRPVELSPQELQSMLELSQQRGVIDADEERLLHHVLSLNQIKVRDMMTPRVDIVAFDLVDDPQKLWKTVASTRFRHIPVYHGNLDHVEGIVLARQVLLRKPKTLEEIEGLMHPARFVPELQQAPALLGELRQSELTIAIAVDEYGGTAGLVTLENVVEHVVGDIVGPSARAEPPGVQMLEPGQWRVSAGLSVHELGAVFGHMASVQGVSTIGGLVMARLGKVPALGDHTMIGNLAIEVEKMAGHRIDALHLRLQGDAANAPNHEGQTK